ncbi:hypothetical protein NIES46_45510 [Arthrospira platensis NIES-46]|jgi:hypothetical protein|uniref:Uncharacterized protein n=1 Tax=Limnospira platensis NIES-46 TaxID=1236695 RepID=A0A5M3TFW6_LIMPL|nr:hypothetical protein [Arthrospira platensis]GCE96479.1 hypothetical protein NIES46_45510 [Arthrospira platensis NIES-46]
MMINSVPANGKLQPELAFAQRARRAYRVACPPEVSPTLSEARSRSLGVRPIAYSLGSATYRLPFQKCDRASVGTASPATSHQTPSASCPGAGMRSRSLGVRPIAQPRSATYRAQRVSSAIPMGE